MCHELLVTYGGLPGWRLCAVWNIHHPALHSAQLVWNILQVWRFFSFIVRLLITIYMRFQKNKDDSKHASFLEQNDPELLHRYGEHVRALHRGRGSEWRVFFEIQFREAFE